MRLKAFLKGNQEYKKALIAKQYDDSIRLFLYIDIQDLYGEEDNIYNSIDEAKQGAYADWGIALNAWEILPDLPDKELGGNWDVSEVKDISMYFAKSLDDAIEEDISEVNLHLAKGDPITALKIYRSRVGVSLQEAKNAVIYLRIRMYKDIV